MLGFILATAISINITEMAQCPDGVWQITIIDDRRFVQCMDGSVHVINQEDEK